MIIIKVIMISNDYKITTTNKTVMVKIIIRVVIDCNAWKFFWYLKQNIRKKEKKI